MHPITGADHADDDARACPPAIDAVTQPDPHHRRQDHDALCRRPSDDAAKDRDRPQRASQKVDETYTGVSLGDLLTKYGFPVDKTTHQKMLRSYIKAEGTDKYWVLCSVTEIEPSEHNADVIVATILAEKPLGEDG